jgi:hypothetical protein
MRRSVLFGLLLLLPGCAYVGDPTVGFGGFIGDTHTFDANPNRAVGSSENMQRVMGNEVAMPPLLTEPGDVWPGPIPPEPTLSDIERQQNQEMEQHQGQPSPGQLPPAHPQPRGSSTPPGSPQPGLAPLPSIPPASFPQTAVPPIQNQPPIVQTPQGPVMPNPSGNGVHSYNAPGGGQGIIVPNGNGTSTLIGPNGSMQTVPTPQP